MRKVFSVISGEQADIEMQVKRSDDDLKTLGICHL
jgi:hypothetical protein